MKKRLLALALCLVMAVSLLPITAAAYTPDDMMGWINGIKNNGIYCKEASFTINCPQDYSDPVVVYSGPIGYPTQLNPVDGQYKITGPSDSIIVNIHFGKRTISYIITIKSDHNWDDWAPNGDGTHSRTCSNGCGTPTTEPPVPCVDANGDHKCDDCKASVHTWQVTKPDSGTLKATCNPGCTIGEVTVKLNAHSVTLPDDPFHATVEVSENFKEAFPSAYITGPEYRYKDSEKGWIDAEPGSFTPKAGQYQAQAYINNLFGDEVAELRAFSKDDGTNQIGNHVDLWVDYTAADPKVTAQTGDNRPIELMMGSVLVFSALTAAAFIADSKRRYQQ